MHPHPSTTFRSDDSEQRREGILRQSDSCVKCGLCLPHCPTYRIYSDEAESPRGRISLIQGWLSGDLAADDRLLAHLDHCLQCGACEQACPSLVPFLDIVDEAKTERLATLSSGQKKLRLRALDTLAQPARLHKLAQLYLDSPLQTLARRSGILRRTGLSHLERFSRPMAQLPTLSAGEAGNGGKSVLLFRGCLGKYMDAGAHSAAVKILQHLGYSVELPQGNHCCGAMHRHDGFSHDAEEQLSTTRERFGTPGSPVILGLASACTAELKRDPELAGRVRDATRFIADSDWPDALLPRPSNSKVLIHIPCSQANLLRDANACVDLLRLIPGIELVELPGNPDCCGAAGTYLLREPAMAGQLLDNKLAPIRRLDADILVSTNTGCSAHLRAGLEEAGLDIPVRHPLELLAEQLPR